jgi:hypothetical protein
MRKNPGGGILPPIFFSLIPSLKEKPPYFNITVTDEQWLPEITLAELEKYRQKGYFIDSKEDAVSSGALDSGARENDELGDRDEAKNPTLSPGSIIFPAESAEDVSENALNVSIVETVAEKYNKVIIITNKCMYIHISKF